MRLKSDDSAQHVMSCVYNSRTIDDKFKHTTIYLYKIINNIKPVEITIVTRSTSNIKYAGGRGRREELAEKQLSKVNVVGGWWYEMIILSISISIEIH